MKKRGLTLVELPAVSKRGFTLVELLVVIGIIALLISILLPTLSSVKRTANTTKCQSNLRQIGVAFRLYENQYDGRWPVCTHHEGPNPPLLPTGQGDRSWVDFLAPYILGQPVPSTAEEFDRQREFLRDFACPAWEETDNSRRWYFDNPLGQQTLLGYAMSYHPTYPTDRIKFGIGSSRTISNFAAITRTGISGRYAKATDWGKPSPSVRGLITDADGAIIFTIDVFNRNTIMYQPFLAPASNPAGNFAPDRNFLVDGTRHGKIRGRQGNPLQVRGELRRTLSQAGMNMLFCDGSVRQVTPEEAYNAIFYPGQDGVR